MPPTLQELGIDQLSPEERLKLIGDIWDSLSTEQIGIPAEHREELDRRLEAAEADPTARRPWPEVRERLRGQE